MSESLRNDGRIWVPKNPDDTRPPAQIPDADRDYFLERKYPAFGNLVPRDVASRNAKTVVDEGKGVGPLKNGVNLDFSDAINRLGASALMQGLADGYFVAPYTIGDYLSGLLGQKAVATDDPAFRAAEGAIADDISRWLSVNGTKSVDYYHRELGKIVWDNIGMARDAAGLEKAIGEIPALREEFRKNVRVLGTADGINQSLEKVGRVDDFFELAELMARDALHREESCGGHFRVEHQTEEGEAKRDDENFAYVGAWEWTGPGKPQNLHKEPLEFEYVHLTQRSYK
jgi:succinate dehydrogenase / fumarate reductase flavoprotein subunit